MASRADYFRARRLTLAYQLAKMKSLFPHFKTAGRGSRAVWTGTLRPSPLSDEYRVKIEYGVGDVPKVWVLSPPLQARPDNPSIPHVYPGPRPCLYLPRSGEWSPDEFIADTIVPWTSLWLFHYEVWRAIGEWLGGGVHPKTDLREE